MATAPYFILSPSTILSVLGLMRGPDKTTPTPKENWRAAKVDVIIPTLNEEEHITLCLASVLRQTLRPRRIMLVDDGSTDRTVDIAEAYCKFRGVEIVTIRRRSSIGKTPTIKRQARELDSDVEFILDGDTVLESDNYIERTVQELYQAVGIASACGTILPQRKRDRSKWLRSPTLRAFCERHPEYHVERPAHPLRDLSRGITNIYRECLYLFLQRFIYRGQVVFLGTTTNPVGCAVAYRRKYVEKLFDHFGPIFGDDLTNSEDIFIGLAMLDEGYRNIQLPDVFARTVEPELQRLPKQVYLWSSAFLQSCYYFDPLVKSPFKAVRRAFRRRGPEASAAIGSTPASIAPTLSTRSTFSTRLTGETAEPTARPTMVAGSLARAPMASAGLATVPVATIETGAERRRIGEPYRQAFGRARTIRDGRPAGWMLMMSAVEKVFFPTALLIMVLLGNWWGLTLTVLIETLVGLAALAAVMKGRRLEFIAKGLLIAPLRYGLLASELVTLGRFTSDMWFTRNRKWRK